MGHGWKKQRLIQFYYTGHGRVGMEWKWCRAKRTALQIILQFLKMVQSLQKSSSFSTGTGVGSVK